MALVGAVAGGRWLGLSLHVALNDSGSPFDLLNAAVALSLLALLYSTTSRYARGGIVALRTFAVLTTLALSSPLLL